MKNTIRSLLFFLMLCFLITSCGTQYHDEKNTINPLYKTTFSLAKGPLDTVLISLNLDTVNNEVIVKSLKLSNEQTLYFSDSLPRFLIYFKLETVDLNFDGYPDIRVLKEAGATGNNWYDTWLYRPSKKDWYYHHFLSTACSVSADSVYKRVITNYTGGFTENVLKIYTVKDTLYEPLASLSSEFQKGKFLISLLDLNKRKIIYRNTTDKNLDLLKVYESIVKEVMK